MFGKMLLGCKLLGIELVKLEENGIRFPVPYV